MSRLENLAELQVQILSTGFVELFKKFDEVKAGLKGVKDSADETGKKLSSLGQSMNQWAVVISRSVGLATRHLEGFARQGLAMSAQGQQLNTAFQQLGFQIGSLFTPEINRAVQAVQSVVFWFRNLTGQQQAHVAMWGKLALGVAVFARVAPQVTAGVKSIGVAFDGLKAVFAAAGANPWVLAILAVVAAVALLSMHSKTLQEVWKGIGEGLTNAMTDVLEVIKALAKTIDDVAEALAKVIDKKDRKNSEKGSVSSRYWESLTKDPLGYQYGKAATGSTLGGLAGSTIGLPITGPARIGHVAGWWDAPGGYDEAINGRDKNRNRNQLSPALGGFESLSHTWDRIALASRNATGGKTPEQETAEATKDTAKNTGRMLALAERGAGGRAGEAVLRPAGR